MRSGYCGEGLTWRSVRRRAAWVRVTRRGPGIEAPLQPSCPQSGSRDARCPFGITRARAMKSIRNAGERPPDAIVHVIGIAAGSVAVAIMLAAAFRHLPAPSTASLAIYGAAMLVMLGCSAAYHMVALPAWKRLLQRFDHAAIFLKIAGTYTPLVIVQMGGIAGYAL